MGKKKIYSVELSGFVTAYREIEAEDVASALEIAMNMPIGEFLSEGIDVEDPKYSAQEYNE